MTTPRPMPKNYRDASTGQYTTAADAAARPGETVSEAIDRLAVGRGKAYDTDLLRDRLAHMTEARDNARAEVERLAALVAEVRKLHEPRVVEVLGPECTAEECDHEDACPPVDYAVCGHCYDVGDGAHYCAYEGGGIENVAYPCPTARTLDGAES